jgi:ADP-ribosylation factor GTPase-activating protein 1
MGVRDLWNMDLSRVQWQAPWPGCAPQFCAIRYDGQGKLSSNHSVTNCFNITVARFQWKDIELEKMKVGGNRNAREFFEDQPDWKPNLSIQQKYNTQAAAIYREKIKALAEGQPFDEKTARSKAAKSASKSSNSASDSFYSNTGGMHQSNSVGSLQTNNYQDSGNFGGGYQQNSGGYQKFDTPEFKQQKENFFSHKQLENATRPENVPPNQGGKYAGFGYSRDPPPRSQSTEIFDTTLSSLASGWSMFSLGATKIASTAKENALKYGSLATQKVLKLEADPSSQSFHSFKLLLVDFKLFFV